jgi:hypothetical protein
MGNLWIADIGSFDKPGTLPAGQGGRKVRFLGEIVSASSLLTPGEFQISAIGCRRRPKRRSCPGQIRLGRHEETDEISWTCTICKDEGVITNWQETRWDLSPELKNGRIVSLSEERARRAGRLISSSPQRVFELEVELLYAPVGLDERIVRRVRINGDNTLQDLHTSIHQSFDRVEDEAYEFMFGPPYDPDTRRYTGSGQELNDDESPFSAAGVRLDSLGLKAQDSFGYLFDFSDEWVHRVTIGSIKEVQGRSVPPQVISRVGESPPQLPSPGEPWDEDLFWNEVETTYPLTGLYGPYLADEGVDPEDWLSLDELERHLLVMESHTHSLPADHPEVASMILHAVVHVLAETYLADLGPRKAGAILKVHEVPGQCRHDAIHRLGQTLVQEQIADDRRTPGPHALPQASKPKAPAARKKVPKKSSAKKTGTKKTGPKQPTT